MALLRHICYCIAVRLVVYFNYKPFRRYSGNEVAVNQLTGLRVFRSVTRFTEAKVFRRYSHPAISVLRDETWKDKPLTLVMGKLTF